MRPSRFGAPSARRCARREELLDELAALVFEHAGDPEAVVQPRRLERPHGAETAPAFGSAAPNTSVPTRAWISAPTHIRHGSTVT